VITAFQGGKGGEKQNKPGLRKKDARLFYLNPKGGKDEIH